MTKREETAVVRWVEKIRLALGELDDMQLPEEHRATIRRCLEHEFHAAIDRHCDILFTQNSGSRWTDADTELIHEFFAGLEPPKGYREQSMRAHELALKLSRDEKTCSRKAIELGYGKLVNYNYWDR